jgi:hypothetical protein
VPVLKARRFEEEGAPSSELSRTLLRSAFIARSFYVRGIPSMMMMGGEMAMRRGAREGG